MEERAWTGKSVIGECRLPECCDDRTSLTVLYIWVCRKGTEGMELVVTNWAILEEEDFLAMKARFEDSS